MGTIKFETECGGKHHFETAQQALDFVRQQHEAWNRLTPKNRLTSETGNVSLRISRDWSDIYNSFNIKFIRQGFDQTTVFDNNIAADINHQIAEKKLCTLESHYGNLIRKCIEEKGLEAGQGAIYVLLHPESVNHNFTIGNFEGIIWAILSRDNITKEGARVKQNAANTDFKKLLEKWETELNKRIDYLDNQKVHYDAKGRQLVSLATKLLVRNRRESQKERDKSTDKFKKLLESWQSDYSNLEKKLTDLEATYNEKLKIEAPVKYWEDKSAKHSKQSIWFGIILVIWSCLGAISLISSTRADSWLAQLWKNNMSFAPQVGIRSSNTATIPSTFNAKISYPDLVLDIFILLGLATLFLWIMRLLVRMFTMEIHLAAECKTRSVMTLTYLALFKEGNAKEEDRRIILEAIYRPMSDGMVKDDGPPTVTLPGLIASGVSKQ